MHVYSHMSSITLSRPSEITPHLKMGLNNWGEFSGGICRGNEGKPTAARKRQHGIKSRDARRGVRTKEPTKREVLMTPAWSSDAACGES